MPAVGGFILQHVPHGGGGVRQSKGVAQGLVLGVVLVVGLAEDVAGRYKAADILGGLGLAYRHGAGAKAVGVVLFGLRIQIAGTDAFMQGVVQIKVGRGCDRCGRGGRTAFGVVGRAGNHHHQRTAKAQGQRKKQSNQFFHTSDTSNPLKQAPDRFGPRVISLF